MLGMLSGNSHLQRARIIRYRIPKGQVLQRTCLIAAGCCARRSTSALTA